VPGVVCHFTQDELRNWKLLTHFRKILNPRLQARCLSPSEKDPRRKLAADPYFSLHLFRLLNPVLQSLRSLCAASHFQRMREVCPAPVSPASFSDAQHLFGSQVLEQIVRDLAQQAMGQVQFGEQSVRAAVKTLTAVDGTVLRALNRMTWAPAAGHGSAIRLHLHFSVFDQCPVDWTLTPANVCERKVWKQKIKPGEFYVVDRLYGGDHLLLKQIKKRAADFVVRLLGNVIRTPVEPPRPLSDQDRRAGVISDQVVELGLQGGGPHLRVIEVHAEGKVLLLATTREDLPAHLIALIYRYRWQIELFFKWFKTMLPCRHWIAESAEGVAIQLYTVMIASLLLMLWTGRRPSKRQMEALRLYWMGFISERELTEALGLQKNQ
jgi:Transposase DDE domain